MLYPTAQYAFFFITYTLLNAIFYTANNIAYSTISALMTTDNDERVQLGTFRYIFSMEDYATHDYMFLYDSRMVKLADGWGNWSLNTLDKGSVVEVLTVENHSGDLDTPYEYPHECKDQNGNVISEDELHGKFQELTGYEIGKIACSTYTGSMRGTGVKEKKLDRCKKDRDRSVDDLLSFPWSRLCFPQFRGLSWIRP